MALSCLAILFDGNQTKLTERVERYEEILKEEGYLVKMIRYSEVHDSAKEERFECVICGRKIGEQV